MVEVEEEERVCEYVWEERCEVGRHQRGRVSCTHAQFFSQGRGHNVSRQWNLINNIIFGITLFPITYIITFFFLLYTMNSNFCAKSYFYLKRRLCE